MHTHRPTQCHEMRNRFDLSDLRLTEMNEEEKARIENHFQTCKHCQSWMSEWELIKFEVRELPELAVPDSVLANVMAQVNAAVERSFFEEFGLALSAFAFLLVALSMFAGEAPDGMLSWCVSFIILLAMHQFAKTRSAPVGT